MGFALPRVDWSQGHKEAYDAAGELIQQYRAFGPDSRVDGAKTAARQAYLSSLARERQDGFGGPDGKQFLAAVQKAIAGFNAEDNQN